MNNREKAEIFHFLGDILDRKGEPVEKQDALLAYLEETSEEDTTEKFLHRVSEIFNKDITSMYSSFTTTQVQVMGHKLELLEKRVEQIENRRSDEPIQWLVIQGIAWVISLGAALVALFVAFK